MGRRFLPTLLAAAALVGGLWLLYAGYGRGRSLAGRAETGVAHLQTGVDGRARLPTHHRYYAAGVVLVLGGAWWLLKMPPPPPPEPKKSARRRRR